MREKGKETKKLKGFLSIMLVLSLFAGAFLVPVSTDVSKAEASDGAMEITVRETISQAYSYDSHEQALFSFSLNTSGVLQIYVKKTGGYAYRDRCKIMNLKGDTLNDTGFDTSEVTFTSYLNKGDYLLQFYDEWHATAGYEYSFKTKFTPSNETNPEDMYATNDSKTSATPFTIGKDYHCMMAVSENTDIYKFSVDTTGVLTFMFSKLLNETQVRIEEEFESIMYGAQSVEQGTPKEFALELSTEICLKRRKMSMCG